MDAIVLNTNFEVVTIIDVYESFIWTERYCECGDFELCMPVSKDVLSIIRTGYYLQIRDSEYTMIIETIRIKTDIEAGNKLIVSGRSLESILDRRFICDTNRVDGYLQNGIETILNSEIISPFNGRRRIDNFIFESSTDPAVTILTLYSDCHSKNLYDFIRDVCNERDIGFKIILNGQNQFVFKLYTGVNRSYEQDVNPYVMFTPNFENLINSNYVESDSDFKNVVVVEHIDPVTSEIIYSYIDNNKAMDIDRRECLIRSQSTQDETNQAGRETLAEHSYIMSLEGDVDTNMLFKYRDDFLIGDVVQIANEYGHESPARIVEVVISNDEAGSSITPTFKSIEDGE